MLPGVLYVVNIPSILALVAFAFSGQLVVFGHTSL